MAEFHPANGNELATAINACTFGDTIFLTAGATYIAPAFGITLIDKGVGSSYITITTDDTSLLPTKLAEYPNNFSFTDPTQYRITTAEAAGMPKCKTSDGYPFFLWGKSSHHWHIYGLEFTNTSDFTGYLIADNSQPVTLDDLPTTNIVEYCFFHPKEEVGLIDVDYTNRSVEKGLGYNGDTFIARHCAMQGFTGFNLAHTYRLDTNAFIYGLGRGDILVENCLLEGQANNVWLGGGGGGFPYPDFQGTVSSATSTTATFSNVTNLATDMLFGVFIQAENDLRWTLIQDPNGLNPTALVSGWGVGKVQTIAGLNVTFEQLTSSVNFRRFRLKFGTGVTGGTFTLNYRGQTGTITFPTAPTISSANTASPTEVTTTGAHGLSTGNYVTISGMSGGVDDAGYDLNRDWTVTVTSSTKFTLDSSGVRTASSGAGKVRSRTALQTNVLNGLVALSNLAPADITSVSGSELYVSSPTFGVTIDFASSVALMLTSDLVVNGAGLTGSGVVTARIEPAWSEGYSDVHPAILPSNGATANWGGLQPVGITLRRNIIPKYPLWLATMGQQKGFGEMKVGEEVLFEGNIWAGQATGMILEVKNQSGAAPWSTIKNVTFRGNLWTDTGAAIAWGPTDGSNRTTPGEGLTITNNLFLNPGDSGDSYFFGNSTVGGGAVELTHNTIFNESRMTFVVVGTNFDGPEEAGFSKAKDWVVRDNFILLRSYFFSWFNETPLNPPYDFGNILDGFYNMTADHNAVINDFLNPEDPGGFFAQFPGNWKIDDTVASVGFIDAPEDLDYTGNYRLDPSSLYAAGNARDASDGTDIGVSYPTLIAFLGFDPWGGSAQSVVVTGQVVFSGGVVIS